MEHPKAGERVVRASDGKAFTVLRVLGIEDRTVFDVRSADGELESFDDLDLVQQSGQDRPRFHRA